MSHLSQFALYAGTILFGVAVITPIIAMTPAFFAWLRQPLSRPVFVLAGTNGHSVDELATQAALPAIIDHDPARRPPHPQSPHRRILVTVALAVLCVVLVGSGVLWVVKHDANSPSSQVNAYMYVNPGHEIVYLEVQGALTSTTGTWLEADRTAKGVALHRWTCDYGANGTTVHIVLHATAGDEVVNGTIDNGGGYAYMDLTLPPNNVGLFSPPAHFVAASWQDWNSAYTSLVAEATP